MPTQRLPFGPWLPDKQSLANDGSLTAKNVIPNGDLFRPFFGIQRTSEYTGATLDLDFTTGTYSVIGRQSYTSLSAYARGAIAATKSNGDSYLYAGDATKLYELTDTGWEDCSRTSSAYTGAENVWDFAKYGEKVIAVNELDNPQIITMGSNYFADLSGSPPKAKTVAVVGDFVVLGNINDGTERATTVKWSGFGDETAWVPNATTQSDEQEIEGNYGRIQKIVGGDFGSIFFERGIVRMEREAPPTIFGFYPMERKRGALSFGSVCDVGNFTFYISNDDVYVYDGRISENIGAGKMARWFFNDANADYVYRMSSAADLKNSLVMWSYVGSGATVPQPNKILVLHWPSQTFSVVELECNALHAYISPGFTLEGLDAITTSLDDLAASLDASAWAGGRLNVGAFNSSNASFTFEGTPLTAVLESKEFDAMPGRIAYVDQVRPVVEGGTSIITIEHGYRANQRDDIAYDSPVSVNDDGAFDVRRSARFHRVRVTIAGGFEKAFGVDLRAKANGKR